jgi:hypothetical protein
VRPLWIGGLKKCSEPGIRALDEVNTSRRWHKHLAFYEITGRLPLTAGLLAPAIVAGGWRKYVGGAGIVYRPGGVQSLTGLMRA